MGTTETIAAKLSPKLVAALLFGVLGFVGLAVTYAIVSGRSVDLWGLKIEEPQPPPVTDLSAATDDACHDALTRSEAQVTDLSAKLDQSITRGELAELWPKEHSKLDVLAALRTKPAPPACTDDDTAECRYEKILNRIGESGGAIDLLHASSSTALLIQKALLDVGAYSGPLDGNAVATKRSLVAFQRKHRIFTNTDTIEGLMGRKTLDKIRTVRKSIVDGT